MCMYVPQDRLWLRVGGDDGDVGRVQSCHGYLGEMQTRLGSLTFFPPSPLAPSASSSSMSSFSTSPNLETSLTAITVSTY